MRLFWAFLIVLTTIIASVFCWWWGNKPIPLDLSFNAPFPSVSFAPFRRGQSPLEQIYPTAQQVEEDIKSLVGVTKGIRTYTSQEGLHIVPELSRRYGFTLTHSAWLGRTPQTNEQEINGLITAANNHPDVIKRVIVGNEVLLRGDLPVDTLISHINTVKSEIQQPVSYADVWAFYLHYPQVAEAVDYLTIHILPYWEDEPVGVENAAFHVLKIYHLMAERFPNKPILIGEIGWPTRGRDRGPAAVSTKDAAQFVRIIAQLAENNGFDYNLVEAFDQPWKAKLEGTVGAFWGVLDQDRIIKYAMSGPVIANPNWKTHATIAIIMGVLASIIAFYRRLNDYTLWGLCLTATMAQILSSLLVWQAMNALWIATTPDAYLWAWTRILLQGIFTGLLFQVIASSFFHQKPMPNRWAERIYIFYGFCAIIATILFFTDGRYRDIPTLEFLVPCFGVTLWSLLRWKFFHQNWRDAFAIGNLFGGNQPAQFFPVRFIGITLVAMAILAPLSESFALRQGRDFISMHPRLKDQLPLLIEIFWANDALLIWSFMLILLSIPYWAERNNKYL